MRTREITLAEAAQYLRDYLPETDLLESAPDMPEKIARYALSVRESAAWGKTIPADVFLAYALVPRVNNEFPEPYHEKMGEALLPRIAGQSMAEAALTVNYWCYEMATYRPTSARTASPMGVINAGYGRCGEESTLAVSALRSVGIPARQVYVPRWAHCDDNHAWIEAWVDGEWRYMGACEPEPVLDSGWFTAAASKSMMVHTRCYGPAPEGERVEIIEEKGCVINRTAAYAPTATLKVCVQNGDAPAAGARVLFELCNAAEFFPICEKETDAAGEAELLTGLGDLRVKAVANGRFVWKIADLRRERRVVLNLAEACELEAEPRIFSLTPPVESRAQPVIPPGEALSRHRARMLAAETARQARLEACRTGEPYADRALGNAGAIQAFLADARFQPEDARALLDTLAEKDFFDVQPDTLADALISALPAKARLPEDIWRGYVLCPRAALEKRLPIRGRLEKKLRAMGLDSGIAVWQTVREAVTVAEAAPKGLYPDSLTALAAGRTSAEGRDVLFVDACRSLGIPARLNPVTHEKEFWENGRFQSVNPAAREDTALVLENASGTALAFGERLCVARAAKGLDETLSLWGRTLEAEERIPVRAGTYHVNCVTRQIDGSVDGVILPVTVGPGEEKRVAVRTPEDGTGDKLLWTSLPPLHVTEQGEEKSFDPGEADIVAFVAPGEEPSEHFLGEMVDRAPEIARRGLRIALMAGDAPLLKHERLTRALRETPGARAMLCRDAEGIQRWRAKMRCGDVRMPFCLALSGDGRGLFAFANYNVGAVAALMGILDKAEEHQRTQGGIDQ